MSEHDSMIYARERFVYNVTEDLLVMIEDKNMCIIDIAEQIGTAQIKIRQSLTGDRPLTLDKLWDICCAIGVTPVVTFKS